MRAALRTHGWAGPSGLCADGWRRLLTAFGNLSSDLRKAIAATARRIATSRVDSESLRTYNACRLIPLDKRPGVRPIGVSEVARRIIGRTIIECARADLLMVAGNSQ